MNTLQKKYCITTENSVMITDQVYRSYMKMSLKLTGYSAVPRSQAYCMYASVDCSSRHMLNARVGGVSMPPTLWEVAPATVTSHQHRCVSLEVSAGQTQKDTHALTGHPPVLQSSPWLPSPYRFCYKRPENPFWF